MIAASKFAPSLQMALDVLDDDGAVVDQDADRQRETAERHGVERLPAAVHHQHAVMIDSGMDARMMRVSRQLPRKSRIISAVSPAAMAPPITTLLSGALTKMD
jgi:Xaa-Pro aminopeptidase